jgi:hypothetical protein
MPRTSAFFTGPSSRCSLTSASTPAGAHLSATYAGEDVSIDINFLEVLAGAGQSPLNGVNSLELSQRR